ncbi:MAG: beta-galactosidase trimerization domain-containing protein, partial [Omnitrophica WOR_2 bacterium]
DQLHPSGKMSAATYDLIAPVYDQVEKREPWCAGAEPVVEIGLFTTEEHNHRHQPDETLGAVQMLQEGAYQFDIIDSSSSFSNYRVLVLPDQIPVTRELENKLDAYLQDGGALIASYHSGLNLERDAFTLKALGVTFRGEAPYSPDFIVPKGPVGQGLPETEHVMYLRGLEVVPVEGCEILQETVTPYFNRTYAHFCSHQHTPSSGEKGYPAILRNGRCVYFSHPIFTQYHKNAPHWVKVLFHNALNLLLPDPLVQVQGPSSLMVTLNRQPDLNRLVLHLLHYIPERRAKDFDTIEDVIPLYHIPASVRTDCPVKQVRAVPQMEAIGFQQRGSRVDFNVPEINGHQMIEIDLT